MLAEQDKPKLVMDLIDEQIDVVSRAFLGLTAGCARCHDHKFDPIPARDYYALAGIFKAAGKIEGVTVEPAEVNGQPGWIGREADGAIVVVMALDILDDQVLGVRSVVNPDKLTHLGRTSDLARRRPR